ALLTWGRPREKPNAIPHSTIKSAPPNSRPFPNCPLVTGAPSIAISSLSTVNPELHQKLKYRNALSGRSVRVFTTISNNGAAKQPRCSGVNLDTSTWDAGLTGPGIAPEWPASPPAPLHRGDPGQRSSLSPGSCRSAQAAELSQPVFDGHPQDFRRGRGSMPAAPEATLAHRQATMVCAKIGRA